MRYPNGRRRRSTVNIPVIIHMVDRAPAVVLVRVRPVGSVGLNDGPSAWRRVGVSEGTCGATRGNGLRK